MVLFGSAADDRSDKPPRDLDIGVLPAPGALLDPVGLSDALAKVAGPAEIDVVDLSHAPVTLRAAALERGVPLYESEGGAWAQAQMAATLERWNTEWLRDLDLRLLAQRRP